MGCQTSSVSAAEAIKRTQSGVLTPRPRKRHMPSENGSHRSRMADTLMSQFQRRPENAFYIEPRSGERYPLDRPRWCADGLKPLLLSPQRGITRDEIERGTCWSRSINISCFNADLPQVGQHHGGASIPQSTAIAVRGAIPWEEGYAFFRRFADRSIDEECILTQAPILAEFMVGVGAQYGLRERPILVGFSNGAIMAATLISIYPDLAAGAVLLRPLSPFATPASTRLPGTPVLIIDGGKDDRRMPIDGRRLAEQMKEAGAAVTHHQLPVGHAVTEADCALVRDWLGAHF
jgi:phospholipase/carboxylesterase